MGIGSRHSIGRVQCEASSPPAQVTFGHCDLAVAGRASARRSIADLAPKMHAADPLASSSSLSAVPAFARAPLLAVVQQHADDAAHLRHVRSVLVRAPHVKLLQLGRLDERLAAHLDGLAVAGGHGQAQAEAALERLGCGEVFTAAVCALEARDQPALQRLLALAPAAPQAWRGVLSAFGWVSPGLLRDIVRQLLASTQAWQRALGIEACRLHRVDPGPVLLSAMQHSDGMLRQAALRTAGELGRSDLLPLALQALDDTDAAQAHAAARAACLLGDRGAALRLVQASTFAADALASGDNMLRALALQALPWDLGREEVRRLAQAAQPSTARALVRAIGWLGDAALVPRLIERMADLRLARLAGEAFTLISGADLTALNLERKPPEGVETGPNEDPADDNVALDEDEGLPWPDPEHVQIWWRDQAACFATGQRCFLGAPADAGHCRQVLRSGTQRQRALAAQQLSLLHPGRPLFPVAQPVWRQQRRLDEN